MNSIDLAYEFYAKHIYDEEKIMLLNKHKLSVAGSVPSVLWELFGALLVERSGAGNTGADLDGWEVKSAKQGGSYEYQYHLNTGEQKLKEDCLVNHLFCSYSVNYENVTVRIILGSDLEVDFFNSWHASYKDNYNSSVPSNQRRQRFRKSISFGYVKKNGTLILEIKNGLIIFRDDKLMSILKKR